MSSNPPPVVDPKPALISSSSAVSNAGPKPWSPSPSSRPSSAARSSPSSSPTSSIPRGSGSARPLSSDPQGVRPRAGGLHLPLLTFLLQPPGGESLPPRAPP